jgi:hypothetical protein
MAASRALPWRSAVLVRGGKQERGGVTQAMVKSTTMKLDVFGRAKLVMGNP